MLDGLEGWHIVIIVAIAAVLFGSGKLPGAARSMGQSLRIFKSELRAGAQDDAPKVTATSQPFVAPQAVESPAVIVPSATPVAEPVAQPTAAQHTGV